MTGKTLSKILGVSEKTLTWNGAFFFYEDQGRVVLRIEIGHSHISFHTNMRVFTAEEKAAAARTCRGVIKRVGYTRVKDWRKKEDKERIRKCFEKMK